jgi:RNA polymerase sigma factor (sigma-70 family)
VARASPQAVRHALREVGAGASDRELLARFTDGRDGAAFRALVQRHGPMVLSVCRALVRNHQDAEDAFQATFLVLTQQAAALRATVPLAGWLHGVAYRVARKAQARFARRRKHEPGAARPEEIPPDDPSWREVQETIHAELNGLAERYRAPLVLCYLQGKTQNEAAEQLGVARNTLKARLERGRAILRARLVRRGLGPAAVLIAAIWPPGASAVPTELLDSAVTIALGAPAPAGALALTHGITNAMHVTKLKLVSTAVVVLTAVGLTLGGTRHPKSAEVPVADAKAAPGAPPAPAAPRSAEGLQVLGTVDTDPPPVLYGLPPVLQSGVVVKVHVEDGDEVKADQPLYEFDATIPKSDVKRAETAVATAETKVKEAQELKNEHDANVEFAKSAVAAAERKVALAHSYCTFVDKKLEEVYKAEGFPPDIWAERKKSSLELLKANVDYNTALTEQDLAKLKLEQLKAMNPLVKVDEAKAAVEQAKAELAKAQAAVDLCVVRAKSAGTIEQVSIGPGTTMGVGTRTTALWLIPAGKRVVRAEVEAEFAHRVGLDLRGRTVTIADRTDPKLTYTGVVRRVGSTFLLKRGTTENLRGGTRVLEVVIEVNDPAPAGKPPLRVGQRVRVNLGS